MGAEASVGSIMIDCNDLDKMVGFWSQVLDLEEAGRVPGYVWMGPVSENGPVLAFQLVPEPREGKNRIHLDLGADDPDAFATKVLELGGNHVEDHTMQDGFHWKVLADPEGNLFCVTARH